MQHIDYPRIIGRALATGGEFADIFVERSLSRSLVCEDSKIEKIVSGLDQGAGIRVIAGDRIAYAYTNDLTERALLDLADSAGRALRGAGPARTAVLNMSSKRPLVDYAVKLPPENTPTETKVGIVLTANQAAVSLDSRIRQATVLYRENRQQVSVFTSDGFLCEDDRTLLTAFVQVVAADGRTVQTGYEPIGGFIGMELFDASPLEQAALVAARRAISMLDARKAPAGKMPVVLSSEAGGTMIHEAVGHGLEADLAQSGLSVYSGRIGERIASPLVTVVDDATLPGRRGSFRFDDEGTDARRTVLVDQGVLKTFLYDRHTAQKDHAASTGNGRRESYKHRPIPRMTNTMILPGTADPAAILRSTPNGLFVRKMGGGQVNTVTGDFVFEVSEGYLIENGAIGEPVRGATLIGNGPQVLLSIDQVGSDLGFSIGTCGKDGQGAPVSDAQPTLRIPEITVGGEVG